jgi:hypothetical protein
LTRQDADIGMALALRTIAVSSLSRSWTTIGC